LIGFGRIGRRLATYLAALESPVAWFDPNVTSAPPRRCESLDQLLEESRAIVVAASYEPGSPPVLDRHCIGALDGKYLVNVARGELIDEEALLAAVEAGRLAGCAVDVIRDEMRPNNLGRWLAAARVHNVIVTPHIGGATFAAMGATEEFLAEKLSGELARAAINLS